MLASLRRLGTPLKYLWIEREGKRFDEAILPGLMTALSLLFFLMLKWEVVVFGRDGIISVVVGFLQIVTGFYIASLAAVATFNKDSMDDPMPGAPTILHIRRRRKESDEQLTRRRFLCFLFGYLSFISLFLYFFGSALNIAAPAAKSIINQDFHEIAKWVTASIFLFIVYNMIVTTLLGLYYMSDRIHRPSSTIVNDPYIAPSVGENLDEDEDEDEDSDNSKSPAN